MAARVRILWIARTLWITRQYRAVLGAAVMLDVVAGAGVALLNPPTLSGKVLVHVPPPKQIEAEATIARSGAVLGRRAGTIRCHSSS